MRYYRTNEGLGMGMGDPHMGDGRTDRMAALHELHAPATSQSRRQELQGMLGLEEQLVVADAGLCLARCDALGSTQDEFVLWSALSACDASLTAQTIVLLTAGAHTVSPA